MPISWLTAAEKVEDFRGSGVVEFAGGFVRKQQGRPVGERDGDGDALLFAAGEFFGGVVEAVSESDEVQEFFGALAALGAGRVGEHHRQSYVFERREVWEQVAAGLLPDEADVYAAVLLDFAGGHPEQIFAAYGYATCRGRVVTGEDIEQGTLSAAARADDSYDLSGLDREVQAPERDDFEVGYLVYLEHVFAEDVWGVVHAGSSFAPVTLARDLY